MTITFEIICLLTALICLWGDSNLVWRSMILFLLITCVTEIMGKMMKLNHINNNQWLYNIFLVFEAGFTSFMFYNLLKKHINSKPLVIGGLALIISVYVYEIILHGFFVFNDYTTTVMSVIFVFYSFFYFFLLIENEQYINLVYDASFWWVAGALFFYFGSTASNLFYPFLKNLKLGGRNITYYIFSTLSVILYGCWIYSFICKRWLTTRLNS